MLSQRLVSARGALAAPRLVAPCPVRAPALVRPASSSAQKIPLWAKVKTAGTFLGASTLVVGGLGVTGFVLYLVAAEVFFPSGETQVFNRAVSLVEKDEPSRALLQLQPGERLKAYGEDVGDRWTRNRPVLLLRVPGPDGKTHMLMRFHVESKANVHGTVVLESIEDSIVDARYHYVALDVPGNRRHYIVAPPAGSAARHRSSSIFDLKWGASKKE